MVMAQKSFNPPGWRTFQKLQRGKCSSGCAGTVGFEFVNIFRLELIETDGRCSWKTGNDTICRDGGKTSSMTDCNSEKLTLMQS